MDYNPSIAHIIGPDGKVYQVLNADGTDWDEETTKQLFITALTEK